MTKTLTAKGFSFDVLKGLVFSPVTTAINIAIMGPPGAGKTTLCQSLLKEAVEVGLKVLYVVTNNPVQLVRDQIRALGILSQANSDQVFFVDGYSWLLGERSEERFQIENASDMAGLSVILSGAAESVGEETFIVFDSPSTLLAYNTEELTVRFLKSHLARMKRHWNIGTYAFETGIHSISFYNEVKADFDTIIELKLEEVDGELRRFVRIYAYRGGHETKWFRLLIAPDRSVKIY